MGRRRGNDTGQSARVEATEAGQDSSLPKGTRVRVTGLQKSRQYNGAVGVVDYVEQWMDRDECERSYVQIAVNIWHNGAAKTIRIQRHNIEVFGGCEEQGEEVGVDESENGPTSANVVAAGAGAPDGGDDEDKEDDESDGGGGRRPGASEDRQGHDRAEEGRRHRPSRGGFDVDDVQQGFDDEEVREGQAELEADVEMPLVGTMGESEQRPVEGTHALRL